MSNKIKLLLALVLISVLGTVYYQKTSFIFIKHQDDFGKISYDSDVPSVQLYFAIKKYAEEYNIPEEYAFTVAYLETGYRGPLHLDYNHEQTSYAGAHGPMQVMLKTARWVNKDNVSKETLISDIDYNVRTSMKLIRQLKNKYKDWSIVFGYYNTGHPIVNGYAIKVVNKNYTWKTDI